MLGPCHLLSMVKFTSWTMVVDLDLGNYERFMNIKLTRENKITTGKVYKHVLEKERRGEEIILRRQFRLFLISVMLFKNGLNVQLGFQWMDSPVQLMLVS